MAGKDTLQLDIERHEETPVSEYGQLSDDGTTCDKTKAATDINACFENVIDDIGGLGRFQYILIFLILGSKVSVVWSALMMVFGGAIPNWHCQWKSDNGSYISNTTLSQKCTIDNSTQLVCMSKYYDPELSTIISEWDLVCERAWISATITTIQMAGILVGGYFAGQVADTFGRKLTYFLSLFLMLASNAVAAFSISWQMFAALRFVIGIGCGFYSTVHFGYLIEFMPRKYRSMVVAIPTMPFWSVMFGLLCWWLHDWMYIQIAIAIATFPWILGIIFVPESYRWLLAKGRLKDAYTVMESVAKWNKRPKPDMATIKELAKMLQHGTEKKHSIVDVFNKSLVKVTCSLLVCWLACGYGYYAAYFGIQQLSGNIYINWILLSSMDFVSIVIWYFTNCIGRKWTTILFYVAGGIAALIVGIIQNTDVPDKGKFVNGFAFISKLCVTSGYGALIVLTSESYPTVVRNIGLSLHNSISRIGAMLAPQLVFASDYIPGLMYLIFGGMMLIAALSSLFIPETKNSVLQDTLIKDRPKSTPTKL